MAVQPALLYEKLGIGSWSGGRSMLKSGSPMYPFPFFRHSAEGIRTYALVACVHAYTINGWGSNSNSTDEQRLREK
jgi:hypothetical protein